MRIVVVNRHVIAANRKHGRKKPPLRVSRGRYGRPSYVDRLEIAGTGRLVYSPDKPLPCGATVWLELDD